MTSGKKLFFSHEADYIRENMIGVKTFESFTVTFYDKVVVKSMWITKSRRDFLIEYDEQKKGEGKYNQYVGWTY